VKYVPLTYLNSNDGTGLLAFGEGPKFLFQKGNTLDEMQSFIDQYKGEFIFINLSYDLKSTIHGLASNNKDAHSFPLATLWVPQYVVEIKEDDYVYLHGDKNEKSDAFISEFFAAQEVENGDLTFNQEFKSRLTKEEYIHQITELKKELQLGNIYEVNFCQEFYAENVKLDRPFEIYFKLNRLTKAPFSSFACLDDFMIFSGSPERFLKKQGHKLLSQPIKGTQRRGSSPEEDDLLKAELLTNPKERAENVMIVDLVRNDLSRIATKNSVQVEELFGVYTFETVHQMISTISCTIEEGTNFTTILDATYPMGSMTGAPKINAMKLIEKHENFQRGIYSGAMGYIDPKGDFDFNVVIRTLIYNQANNYISCPVGGAITIQSTPELEYEECLIKVKSILEGMNA